MNSFDIHSKLDMISSTFRKVSEVLRPDVIEKLKSYFRVKFGDYVHDIDNMTLNSVLSVFNVSNDMYYPRMHRSFNDVLHNSSIDIGDFIVRNIHTNRISGPTKYYFNVLNERSLNFEMMPINERLIASNVVNSMLLNRPGNRYYYERMMNNVSIINDLSMNIIDREIDSQSSVYEDAISFSRESEILEVLPRLPYRVNVYHDNIRKALSARRRRDELNVFINRVNMRNNELALQRRIESYRNRDFRDLILKIRANRLAYINRRNDLRLILSLLRRRNFPMDNAYVMNRQNDMRIEPGDLFDIPEDIDIPQLQPRMNRIDFLNNVIENAIFNASVNDFEVSMNMFRMMMADDFQRRSQLRNARDSARNAMLRDPVLRENISREYWQRYREMDPNSPNARRLLWFLLNNFNPIGRIHRERGNDLNWLPNIEGTYRSSMDDSVEFQYDDHDDPINILDDIGDLDLSVTYMSKSRNTPSAGSIASFVKDDFNVVYDTIQRIKESNVPQSFLSIYKNFLMDNPNFIPLFAIYGFDEYDMYITDPHIIVNTFTRYSHDTRRIDRVYDIQTNIDNRLRLMNDMRMGITDIIPTLAEYVRQYETIWFEQMKYNIPKAYNDSINDNRLRVYLPNENLDKNDIIDRKVSYQLAMVGKRTVKLSESFKVPLTKKQIKAKLTRERERVERIEQNFVRTGQINISGMLDKMKVDKRNADQIRDMHKTFMINRRSMRRARKQYMLKQQEGETIKQLNNILDNIEELDNYMDVDSVVRNRQPNNIQDISMTSSKNNNDVAMLTHSQIRSQLLRDKRRKYNELYGLKWEPPAVFSKILPSIMPKPPKDIRLVYRYFIENNIRDTNDRLQIVINNYFYGDFSDRVVSLAAILMRYLFKHFLGLISDNDINTILREYM